MKIAEQDVLACADAPRNGLTNRSSSNDNYHICHGDPLLAALPYDDRQLVAMNKLRAGPRPSLSSAGGRATSNVG
jgi:hypothetical protein